MKRGMWWVIAGVVLVVLAGGWYYVTQTEQGRFWLLGLSSRTEVPNVVGQSQASAESALKDAGLLPGPVSEEPTLAVPPGTVTSQTPVAGSVVRRDAPVGLAVSIAPTVTVPGVVGQTESDAEATLAEEGLRTATQYAYSSSVPAGEVVGQAPPAGAEASVTSVVALSVSKGKQQGQVPNVVGLPQHDANAVLSSAGFKVTTIKATSSSVPAGDVVAQSPAAGVVTAAGSTVTITVSTGVPAPAAAPPAPSPAPSAPPSAVPPKPESPKTEVPNVVGKRVLDAVTTLQKAQLKVAFAWERSEGDFLTVITQAPSAGSSSTPGDIVTITIGLPAFSFELPPPETPAPMPTTTPAPPITTPAPPSERPTVTPLPSPVPSGTL